MIKCPECKKDVSESAVTCPSCGHPLANALADPQREKPSTEKNGMSGAGLGFWRMLRQKKATDAAGTMERLGVLCLLFGIWESSGHNLRAINDPTQMGLLFLLIAGILFALKKK